MQKVDNLFAVYVYYILTFYLFYILPLTLNPVPRHIYLDMSKCVLYVFALGLPLCLIFI